MRKLTKKISMLMVLAMLVGLFSGVVSASAASKWAFKSNDLDVAVGATVNLDQNQYENFDLYKSGAIADEATYTITWESSDEKVVFVNAKTGQLRAKKDAADGAEAVITANIVNNSTKGTHKVSFTVVVGEVKVPVYTVEQADITAELGAEIKFAPVVKNEAGEVVKFPVHKSYNGYFVDGKAITNPWTPEEAGEYTVTVAQFANSADKADLAKAIEGRKVEVKVVVVDAKAFEAKQIDMTTVNLTFGSEEIADAFVKGFDGKLGISYTLKDSTDVIDDIASLKEVKLTDDKKVAQIVMFGNIVSEATYTLSYNGVETTFVGAKAVPASIVVVEKSYAKEVSGKLLIDVYNADGVKINGGYDTNAHPVSWTVVSGDENKYFQYADEITIYEKGVEVVVKATLGMGYDAEGNENTKLSDEGKVSGTDNISDARIHGFKLNNEGNWATTLNMFAGTTKKLTAQFKRTTIATNSTNDKVIDAGAVDLTETGYKYSSSNPTVAMIDDGGNVSANSAGVATLFVKNPAGNTIGTATLKVEGKLKLATFSAYAEGNKTNLSVDSAAELSDEDMIVIKYTAKDQFGNDIALSNLGFEYTIPDKTATALFDIDASVFGKIVIKPLADAATLVPGGDEKTASYRLTIKVTDLVSYASGQKLVSIAVKDVNVAKVQNIVLDMANSVDMLLVQGQNYNVTSEDSYNVNVKAKRLDAAGFFLGYEEIDNLSVATNDISGVATGAGMFTLFVTENGQAVNGNYRGKINKVDSKTVRFTPVTVTGTDQVVRFKNDGSAFAFRLFEGKEASGLKTWNSVTLKVTNSSAAASVVQKKNVIGSVAGGSIAPATLFDALDIYYAGKKLEAGKSKTGDFAMNASYSVVGDTTQVFITDVTIPVTIREYNDQFEAGLYEYVTVPVNKLFTIAD